MLRPRVFILRSAKNVYEAQDIGAMTVYLRFELPPN